MKLHQSSEELFGVHVHGPTKPLESFSLVTVDAERQRGGGLHKECQRNASACQQTYDTSNLTVYVATQLHAQKSFVFAFEAFPVVDVVLGSKLGPLVGVGGKE